MGSLQETRSVAAAGAVAVSANNLLFWMSARAAGSWAQFRAAVEEAYRLVDMTKPAEAAPEPETAEAPR